MFHVIFPIIKLFIFYFHLLIYGEFILSFSDLISIFLTIWKYLLVSFFIILVVEIDTNYYHCFNNEIFDNKIVIKEEKTIIKIKFFIFLIFFILLEDVYNSIYIKSIPLIISIISTIYKHLSQREVMCKKDNNFCIKFYTVGIAIYSFHLLIYNLGYYYRVKPSYSFFPFFLIIILCISLIIIIKNEYKFSYVMKNDFERLKILDEKCCPICLNYFDNNKNKINKLFLRVTQDENIHQTSCNHYFHERCLFNWRQYKNICPVCRKPLQIQNYYYFYDETPCIYKPYWL